MQDDDDYKDADPMVEDLAILLLKSFVQEDDDYEDADPVVEDLAILLLKMLSEPR